MDLYQKFASLPLALSDIEFPAVSLNGLRSDFLAKARDGSPVLLLQDASIASYSPAIVLKHVSVQFHNTCRITTESGPIEDQFAVITCDASTPELYEIFIRSLTAAVEQLPVEATTSDLQQCVQSLLDLFRALSRPSNREVTGLWAELFLIAKSKNVTQAMRAWHADQFERFDFSSSMGCIEVKATTGTLRQHEFSLEQLQMPLIGHGYVASIMLQKLAGGIGIIDLAKEINASVTSDPILGQKLWGNIAASLGNDFSERLDRKFDASHAERSLIVYKMSDIPAPDSRDDSRITSVRFRVDLSNVDSSLTDSPRGLLSEFFN